MVVDPTSVVPHYLYYSCIRAIQTHFIMDHLQVDVSTISSLSMNQFFEYMRFACNFLLDKKKSKTTGVLAKTVI